jgi:hypothetical protein
MSRASDQLAPSWLPRQQRRHVNRQLHKLLRHGTCSICGRPLNHHSRTTSGLDAQGNVVVAGECCRSRVAEVFGLGLYSDRQYDFMSPRKPESNVQPTNEQIVAAIAAYQEAVADSDKRLADVERRGGVKSVSEVFLLDHPWKDDDREWFERNPTRSHRMRAPFPNELDGVKIPAGRKMIVFVRQVEPGRRLRAAFDPDVVLLPGSPHDEAFAHALFEVAVGHEAVPSDHKALDALIKKYTTPADGGAS